MSGRGHERHVGRFFDALSGEYAEAIERCFPRYREMLWALLDYLPAERPVRSVLELGCGTGNLSVLLAAEYPQATIHVVDVSPESLDLCRRRLGEDPRFRYELADFRTLDLPPGSFDLVASSIAVHHVDSAAKRKLFRSIHDWLRRGGVLAMADQFSAAASDVYRRHIENWRRDTLAAGSTEEQWRMWMQHQREHDYHDPLADQIGWLREAGLAEVDCPWRYLLWTVVQARKPGTPQP